MQYLSDNGKIYSSEEECVKADKEFKDSQAEKEKLEREEKAKISKCKKELVDKIKEANDLVNAAYKDYEDAKKEVKSIRNEANKNAKAILEEAENKSKHLLTEGVKRVENATEKRMLLIKEFNENFGPYTESYTGDKACQEYTRIANTIKNIFSDFDLFGFYEF